MPHCLIFGMTESGKTTLAKRLAARNQYHGVKVIVLDSLNDPQWPCDFQTTDPDEFLAVFWSSRKCAVFIDEAGDAVGRYNVVMQRTATRGRHWGHNVHFISQRGVQIAPTVRDQCSHIFLLTSSSADGKIHANEWNAPVLANCHTLQKGQYFHATRFGEVTRGSLFGVPFNDTDTNSRNGGRNLRQERESAAPQAPAQRSAAEDARPSPAGPDPRPGSRSDPGPDPGPDPAERSPKPLT
jgi:hypothetical protein